MTRLLAAAPRALLASAALLFIAGLPSRAGAESRRWETNLPVDPQLLKAAAEDSQAQFSAKFDALGEIDRAALARKLGDDPAQAKGVTPALINMLEDPSAFVRAQAAASLARLGEPAFPALIDSLAADRMTRASSNEAETPISAYVSWVLANSVADPGPRLVAWARQAASAEAGPDLLQFASITLGMRGAGALPYATEMLRSADPFDQKLGVLTAKVMGGQGEALAPGVARFALSSDQDLATEAIAALGLMGDPGQAELARLFEQPAMADYRYMIDDEMRPGPATLEAQLRVARWGDEESRRLALQGLVRQPDIQASAIPVLLTAAGGEDAPDEALRALSRLPTDAGQQAEILRISEAKLDGRLRGDRETYIAQGAILALAGSGTAGQEILRARLANPATHRAACDEAHFAFRSESYDERGPSQASLQVGDMTRNLCADVWPISSSEPDEVEAESPATTPTLQALVKDLRDADREVARDAAEAILAQTAEGPEWSEAAEVATALGVEDDVQAYVELVETSLTREPAHEADDRNEEHPDRTPAVAAPESSADNSPPPPPPPAPPPPPPAPPAVQTCPDGSVIPSSMTCTTPPLPPPAPPAPRAERDGPDEIITTAARRVGLPKFPWPPPRYTSIVTFGRDIDRSLLGKDSDKLSDVEHRLTKALESIDPNFESGLFAAPGGFVLLTRLEQTDEAGHPLRGRNRWRDTRPPPSSASDYLVRLFTAPPGYYRTIAFVFTDQSNFVPGTASLPSIGAGGTVLPRAVGAVTFGQRNAFALIYSYQRRDTGTARPYRLVGGRQHLQESGVIGALGQR